MTDSRAVKNVAAILEEVSRDTTVPRNVKEKIEKTLAILKEKGEVSLKINRALHELEEVTDDINLQPYTRMQLLDIVSILEKLA